MTWELGGIILYFIVQLIIGQLASRKVTSEQDYFLAGRSLGVTLAAVSTFATWFGAENCIGTAGATFKNGISGSRIDPMGYTLCLVLFGFLMAGRLRAFRFTTLADLYRTRYSGLVEKLSVAILIPSSIIWAGSQVRAFGQILSFSTNLSINEGIFLATFIVVAYTFMGGMLADVLSNFLQSIVLILGLFILLYFVVENLGGIEKYWHFVPKEKISFNHVTDDWLSNFEMWSIPILGSITSQEIVSKALACKTPRTATVAAVSAGFLYLIIGTIPVFIGLVGHHFIPLEVNTDDFLLLLAKDQLPRLFFIIFSGAMISAILSTVDSNLLTISALFTHNLYIPMKPNISEKKKIFMGRMIIIVAGIFGLVMALYANKIRELVELASSLGTSGLLVITIFGLWGKFGGPLSAIYTLIVGLLSYLVAKHLLDWSAPYLFSVVLSFLTYVIVALFEKKLASNM